MPSEPCIVITGCTAGLGLVPTQTIKFSQKQPIEISKVSIYKVDKKVLNVTGINNQWANRFH